MASKHIIYLASGDDTRRRALARALRQRGLEVLEFARGSELFERALAAPPDLIVSTLDLEAMDGFQVVEWLRRRRPETFGRIVFLMREADPVLEEACTLRGARACLNGAAAPDLLADAIEVALAGKGSKSRARPAPAAAIPAALARSLHRSSTGRSATPSAVSAARRATPPALRPNPAGADRASRGDRERAAIAALRERWHARDGSTQTATGGAARAAPRRLRIAALAVWMLVLCGGLAIPVVRSADFAALMERLDELRALAAENAVQAVRAPARISGADTQRIESPDEAPAHTQRIAAAEASPDGSGRRGGRTGSFERPARPPAPPGTGARTEAGEGSAGRTSAAVELVTPVAARGRDAAPAITPVPVQPAAPAAAEPSGRAPDYSLAAIRDRPQFVFVDVPPSPRAAVRPRYPWALAERRIGGVVTLWVLVSETGRVEDVRVLRSSGHAELDKVALDALRLASYAPGRRGGVAVPTWTQQQIAFHLD